MFTPGAQAAATLVTKETETCEQIPVTAPPTPAAEWGFPWLGLLTLIFLHFVGTAGSGVGGQKLLEESRGQREKGKLLVWG